MNILITGSNGFVGSTLMWRLVKEGHQVVGIDISKQCDSSAHPDTIIGDIRRIDDLETAYRTFQQKHQAEIELVIHCAAAKHDFGITEQEYYSHNEQGTKVLLGFINKKIITNLINFSTVSVFGHPESRTDEDGKFAPDHPYGGSKLAGELLCTNWQAQDANRELIVLRPTVIYGPHNFANMYKMIDMMHRHPYITIGSGSHIKSIVSLANIVDMTVFAISILKKGAQYFNCVDKPYITIKQLMQIIASNPAFKIPKLQIPVSLAVLIGKLFDIPAKLLKIDLPVNSDRMQKLATATDFASERIRNFGYIQVHSIEEQIKEMTDWYLTLRGNK